MLFLAIFKNQTLTASVSGKTVFSDAVPSLPAEGFVAIGGNGFGLIDFDDFALLLP
jgi:hypothetical protein